ncbi:TauD/TfdA family dioxygenase [Phenylobacterium sp. LjRoot219]|uniref:TauD/TfdA dioxygenase family protein n=1 Tax=Phenylobacterium sp. LjRoot219 TaxID=3342283 RepID=UPI003ECEE9D3
MASIEVKALQEDLPFGARIRGVTQATLKDEAVRRRINEVFEQQGMIVFEDVEPTSQMQVMISEVFGPLKEHPVKMVERLDEDKLPGVITIRTDPKAAIVEIDGQPLMTWQPWHFDHSYNNELNRAGVLRAEAIAPEGGLTAFADGVQIYNAMSPEIRAKIETLNLIYTLDLRYTEQRFGLPKTFREIQGKGDELAKLAATLPRAIHPAVWTRKTGEKVLHMSPYGARGIEGMDLADADALLHEVWAEVERAIAAYYHQWKPTDMLVWDNWRMLHQACGCDPKHHRVMHRTTIKGDYGLGRWETAPEAASSEVDAMM